MRNIPAENFIMLLKTVSFVKDLSLCVHFPIAVFSRTTEINWPVLLNVTRLELYNLDDFDSHGFSSLPVLPNLQHLQLNIASDFTPENLSVLLELAPNLASFVLVTKGYRKTHEQINCSEQRVPSCFRTSLREIEVRNFTGLDCELYLIKFLLVNSQVLEKLTVKIANNVPCKQQKAVESKSKIDMMPRCSKKLELHVYHLITQLCELEFYCFSSFVGAYVPYIYEL